MTINTRAAVTSTTEQPLDILALYRTMVTARVTNDLLKTRKTQGRFPFILDAQGTRVWQQLPQLSTWMTGCPSTIVTWLHGCSAQVIFMVLCAKLIPARP